MRKYVVKSTVTLTAQPGSVVILTDEQAALIKIAITEAGGGRNPKTQADAGKSLADRLKSAIKKDGA